MTTTSEFYEFLLFSPLKFVPENNLVTLQRHFKKAETCVTLASTVFSRLYCLYYIGGEQAIKKDDQNLNNALAVIP